jgi:AAA domain
LDKTANQLKWVTAYQSMWVHVFHYFVPEPEGGVRKSTLSINVAACLAMLGQRVLLIDADKQGTASTWASLREAFYCEAFVPSGNAHSQGRARTKGTKRRPESEVRVRTVEFLLFADFRLAVGKVGHEVSERDHGVR